MGITDKIAFLSPCIAKKSEFKNEYTNNLIDYNISFEKLCAHLKLNNINIYDFTEVDFDNVASGFGMYFSRPGGLKENLLHHLPNIKIKQIEGQDKIYEYLKFLSKGCRFGGYDFVDVLNCNHGCNVGTASCKEYCGIKVSNEFEKELLSDKRLKNQNKRSVNVKEYEKLFRYFDETLNLDDFTAKYRDKSESTKLPSLSKGEIEAAFALLNKNDEASRKINCYSCGYRTCEDMAIAICNNYNVPSSCYQYNKQELEEQKNTVEENEKYTRTILEHLAESVIVTDEFGVIKFVNKKTQDIFGYELSEYPNKHIKHFIRDIDMEEIKESTNYEFEITNKNKNPLYLELEFSTISFKSETSLVFIMSNITKEKELDSLKNQFVSMISHELRTPLTSIRGALGLVSSGVLGNLPDKVKELVNIAGNNSVRLVNLINDILDLEKIKAGKMDFNFDEYEIMPLVEETIDFNKEYGKQYNVEYVIVKRLDNALVNLDKDRFIQVLTNLLSNAAKFSTPNRTVDISVEKVNHSIRLSVTNKGVGIPKESYAKIFESFSQVDSADNRGKGGTGLGLSISRSIIQKMGGNIAFTSSLNDKTTFYFELPEIYQKGNRECVLICEDELTTAFCIKKMFEKIGYQADVALSAKEVLELLTLKDYKLMTLDIILPDKNGLELLDEIRLKEKTKDLPVIVISVCKQDCAKISARHDIVAWLEKSFDSKELEDTINKIMIKKHKNRVNILHVEHNDDILEVMSSTMKEVANVIKVKNLTDAEKIISEIVFDIIIFDYRFPNGTCEKLVTNIKNTPNNKTNLVVFSAYEISPSLSEQVDLVICKTKVSNEQFMACIEPFISKTAQAKGVIK